MNQRTHDDALEAPDPDSPLARAVEIAGTQTELARRIGGKVKQQHVHYWLSHNYVPAEHVLAIEAATAGAVKRHELRPDLYPDERAAACG